MSDLFNHTPQNTTVSNQVELLAEEVSTAFELLENLVNISNNYTSSVNSSIGSLDTSYLKEYHPDNGKILGYTQNLYFPLNSKEASLTLVPSLDVVDLASLLLTNLSHPSSIYTYKADGILNLSTDYTIINKKIILKETPVDQFTLNYNGYAYVDGTSDYNLHHNIIEFDGLDEFPVLDVGIRQYEVGGYDFKSKCSSYIKSIINAGIEPLAPYVSIFSNNIKIPIETVSITNTTVSFTTTEATPDGSLNAVKIYVANTSLSDLVKALYKIMYTHNHSTTEGTNVNHRDLLGLFTNNSSINYTVSSKENYDHPQYFNREGYIADPTVYNNAILGDILVASTDSSNSYNNLVANSNNIIFGSYANGTKLYYDKDLEGVVLDASSDKNGLFIKTAFNKVGLKLNNNYVTNKELLDGTKHIEVMLEESETNGYGIIRFTKRKVDTLTQEITSEDEAKLYVKYSEIGLLTVNTDLVIPSTSKVTFGSPSLYTLKLDNTTGYLVVSGKDTSSTYKVDFKNPIKAVEVSSEKVISPAIMLDNTTSQLSFGINETITYTGNYLTFTTNKSTNFRLNGYRKGLSLDKKYWMYTSSPTGETLPENTLTNQNLYIETLPNGSIHFIKNTENIFTEGVSDLNNLEKADIHSGTHTLKNLYVSQTNSTTNGISLDLVDNNKLFAGKDSDGNLSTIFKTNGKVLIANTYAPSSVSTPLISYGELVANKLTTVGDKGTSSGYYGNVFIPNGYKLTINGDVIFSSDITFTTNVTMANKLTTKDLVSETISVETITSTDTIVGKDLTMSDTGNTRLGNTEVRQGLEVTKAITQNSSNSTNIFNGQLKVVGKVEFLSGLNVSNSVINGVINSPIPASDESVGYALLTTEQSKLRDSVLDEVDVKMNTFIDTILNRAWPMYSIYLNSVDERNPAVIMNFGIWERDLEGRSPIGRINTPALANDLSIPDTLKGSLGSLYGEYNHSLTSDENGPHFHISNGINPIGDALGMKNIEQVNVLNENNAYTDTGNSRSRTAVSGLGTPHNTVHPVQVVSIWKRIG